DQNVQASLPPVARDITKPKTVCPGFTAASESSKGQDSGRRSGPAPGAYTTKCQQQFFCDLAEIQAHAKSFGQLRPRSDPKRRPNYLHPVRTGPHRPQRIFDGVQVSRSLHELPIQNGNNGALPGGYCFGRGVTTSVGKLG